PRGGTFWSQQPIRSLGRLRSASATAGSELTPTRLAKFSTPLNKVRVRLLAGLADWDLGSPFPRQWFWRMGGQSLRRVRAGIKALPSRFGLPPLRNQPNTTMSSPRTVVNRQRRPNAFRARRGFSWLTIIKTPAPD